MAAKAKEEDYWNTDKVQILFRFYIDFILWISKQQIDT
jgi:hypothetical protein